LCTYTHLPATVKLVETFHFVKSFSVFSFILNDVISVKRASLSLSLSVEGTGKISWSLVRIREMFQCCNSFLR
jgi:hypothetical protein